MLRYEKGSRIEHSRVNIVLNKDKSIPTLIFSTKESYTTRIFNLIRKNLRVYCCTILTSMLNIAVHILILKQEVI